MSSGALAVELTGQIGALPLALSMEARGSAGPVVIVGPNGAGKTSALMLIVGALKPRSGRIVLDGEALFDGARGVDVPVEQRRIGFLPQRYALFPHLDVLGNVMFGVGAAPRAARERRARAALRDVGVEELVGRRIATLSGGEAQRVALARALARGPRALLLDEPLAALDAGIRREVRAFLAAHLRTLGIPTVIVTHDRADAEAFAGQMLVLEQGRVVQQGSLAQLEAQPATLFTRQFVDHHGG
jgi:molybdate transport system ATP-binding protein